MPTDIFQQFELSTNEANPFSEYFSVSGNGLALDNGPLQSENYVPGVAGWRLSPDDAEFNVGVSVDSIDIPDTTTANSFHVDSTGNLWLGATTFGAAPFTVSNAGALTATGATITGTVTATSGTIGGFTIGATTLTATNLTLDSSGQRISLGSSNDIIILDADDATYRLSIGNATMGSAPFRVEKDGSVIATDFTATGGSISGVTIASIPNNSTTDISLLNYSYSMVFSVTDADTIAWSSGTVTLSNGRTFSISAGNTGNMSALTYIYLDPATSTTVLQVTTTFSTAVGANKVLIGTAQNHSITASFIPFNGGQPLIDGTNIGALSVLAGNIAAGAITATKINVANLSAINADMGTLTAGKIDVGNIEINAGTEQILFGSATAPLTGTGVFLGKDGSDYEFRAGDPSGAYIHWNGSSLTITGSTFLSPIISQHTAGETLTTGQVVAISDGATPYSISGVAGEYVNSGIDINTTQWTAKRFTTGPQDTSIKHVWVLLRNDSGGAGTSGNLTVSIQAISGGNPDGTDIGGYTATPAYSLGTSTQKWIQCTFATGPTVSPSTSYYAVIKSDSGGGARNVAENATASGDDRETTTSGASWASTTFDCIVVPLGLGIAADRTMKALALESSHTDFTSFVDGRYFPAGIAQANTTQAVSGNVIIAGGDTVESGMTQSRLQYLHTTTLGGITSTAPSIRSKIVGKAITATKILVTNGQ